MPLAEILITAAAPAIAKAVLKLWTGDGKSIEEIGGATVDILGKLVPDVRARNEAGRQLAAIGERAAESLQFVFDIEGKTLFIEDQEAVAQLVAETIDKSKITTELLVQKDLDPVRLASHFISESEERLAKLPPARADLFRRVIGEASQSIIDIAHSLPNFSERTIGELLRRSQALVAAVERVFDELERLRSQTRADPKAESSRFETDYRRAVTRNLDKMELFGVDLERTSRSQRLSVAYVSLEVGRAAIPSESAKAPNPKKPLGEKESPEESVIQNVETALAGHQRILIKGNAGAGKTTLIRWIAVRAASRGFEKPLEHWNDALPFVIRLRDFSASRFPKPEEFPALVAPSISGTIPSPDWVHQRLTSGSAVVMVDGVDEVAENRRDEVRQWIKDLTGTFPLIRLIVTSRPYAVDEGWLEGDGFGEADLQPMDILSIEKFIDHWHRAIAELVTQEADVAGLAELGRNLRETLRSNRAIRRLATNPLLCGVICALHRDTNQQLPKDRVDLYERCCSMLLERRDPESGLKLTDYPQLAYRQKRALLDDLSYWMIKNEWTQVSIDAAKGHLSKKLKNIQDSSTTGTHATPANVLGFFLERSGMLREPVEGKLDFAHRTFQEYTAAQAAIEEGDIGVLANNATNPQWREVIVLGAGLARPRERRDLIMELIKKGDQNQSQRHQLHLLAAACLETSVEVDSTVREEVRTRVSRLIPPSGMAEATLLADAAGEIAVPFLKHTSLMYAAQAAACVRALGLIGSLEALQAIADYASDGRITVLREVVRAAERFEVDLYSRWVGEQLDATALSGDLVGRLVALGVSGMKRMGAVANLALSGNAIDLSVVEGLPNLKILTVSNSRVTDLAPLRSLKHLETISILSLSRLSDLSPVHDISKLRDLRIFDAPVSDISPLQGLSNLQKLDLSSTQVSDILPLRELTSLQDLDISSTPVKDLHPLKDLSGLRSLDVQNTMVADISPLKGLTNLTTLYLSNTMVSDISPLEGLINLRTLSLSNTPVLNLVVLKGLAHLAFLDLKNTQVSDLSSLNGIASLRQLQLSHTKVTDLGPLEALFKLESLHLINAPVSDLSPLRNAVHLRSLDLEGTNVSDVSPLGALTGLGWTDLYGTQISVDQARWLQKTHPNLTIHRLPRP